MPARSVTEFIQLAKKNPGKLNGSAGGNSSEMTIALFRIKTDTRTEIIPYKGTGPALTDVMGGVVPLSFVRDVPPHPIVAAYSSSRLNPISIPSFAPVFAAASRCSLLSYFIVMVMRVRETFVTKGLDAVLIRKRRETPPTPVIFDGEAQTKLTALACLCTGMEF